TVAALLLAVHPVHVEAVANVVGRAEVPAALFICIGLLLFLPDDLKRLSPLRAAVAGLAFLMALLAKETAVCYPGVALIALHHVARAPAAGNERISWRRLAMLGLLVCWPLAVYFPLRIAALEGSLIRAGELSSIFNPLFTMHGMDRVIGVLTVFGHYVRLLV